MNFTTVEKPFARIDVLGRLLNTCNIRGYAAMMSRSLLQKLVQKVPEDLSVCEFDCPMKECTVRDWKECELYHRGLLSGSRVSKAGARNMHTEIPAPEIPATVLTNC